MIRTFLTLCSVSALLSLGACRQPPAETDISHFTAANTPDWFPVKACINMGHGLEVPVEGDWGYEIKADHFRIIAEAGFDTIRLPVRWDVHTSHKAPYTVDPRFMRRVVNVVKQAQDQGLGVILNQHIDEALIKDAEGEQARFISVWKQISETFREAPENVYFELFNEPVAPMTDDQASALYAAVIPVIRKLHPKRPLIMGGSDWNHSETLKNITWPDDPYIVATFHDYGPFAFTHQGAPWLSHPPKTGRQWGRPSDRKDLRDVYEAARLFHDDTGLPIFVGEFGTLESIPTQERVNWTRRRLRTIERYGYSWCAWDFGGAFELYDHKRGRWHPGVKNVLVGN